MALSPPEALSPADLKKAMVRYRDVLFEHQQELNDLNVFPVPDGDSGTNLKLTMDAVVAALEGAHDMVSVCRAMSKGAMRGARGNSGVILSQILHGMAKVLARTESASGSDLAEALRRGTETAYDAVSSPKEGTILTVVRAAAEGAEEAVARDASPPAGPVLEAARRRACRALEQTTEMLPELRAAGVVDSGAKGMTLLLEAVLAELEGRPVPEPEAVARPESVETYPQGEAPSPRYEVMFFLEVDDFAIAHFRSRWAELGDSVIVAGEKGFYNCHIHTDHIGPAIEAAIEVGTPTDIRVTDLSRDVRAAAEGLAGDGVAGVEAPHGGMGEGVADALGTSRPGPVADRARPGGAGAGASSALIALAQGEGARVLFEGLGADVVLDPSDLSIEGLVAAIERCEADSVVVVPNGEANAEKARRAARRSDKEVAVVSTTMAVEALPAIVAFDPWSGADANAGAMNDAASRVKSGRVVAVDSGYAAIDQHGCVARTGTLREAALALLDALIGPDDEVLTVLTGAGAAADVTGSIRDRIAERGATVVPEIHEGGGPDPYLFGVE